MENPQTAPMRNWQIRTNARSFGDVMGVYIVNEKKFVKQTSYSHGTFKMEASEARKLAKELKDSFRGSWTRLYEVIG